MHPKTLVCADAFSTAHKLISAVFNHVEELISVPRAVYAWVPELIRAHGRAVTGNSALPSLRATDKAYTRALLAQAGVPVPKGCCLKRTAGPLPSELPFAPPLFVKVCRGTRCGAVVDSIGKPLGHVQPCHTDGSDGIQADISLVNGLWGWSVTTLDSSPSLQHTDLAGYHRALHHVFDSVIDDAEIEQFVGEFELAVPIVPTHTDPSKPPEVRPSPVSAPQWDVARFYPRFPDLSDCYMLALGSLSCAQSSSPSSLFFSHALPPLCVSDLQLRALQPYIIAWERKFDGHPELRTRMKDVILDYNAKWMDSGYEMSGAAPTAASLLLLRATGAVVHCGARCGVFAIMMGCAVWGGRFQPPHFLARHRPGLRRSRQGRRYAHRPRAWPRLVRTR